ncbi:hypothetical protein JAAARDRAFT_695453 [Jaapia argillacea MUCL 33604]|uniref:Peptidylprolyl isomerase n=1 Tax=Jaapia argillacea MUCL 33604 TaxID=933084 RepID=A0A067QJ40_9AGAM|nr:hypothetical protein JAAARDRAFT_695453 [Jaapia argillacea MUCL 33604]
MGHGNSDKLYITHEEHSGRFGQHTAGTSGFKACETGGLASATPFDSCTLTGQPFTNPVCARNTDGTGNVFDLINIVPWLKAHDNVNPISQEALTPAQLIPLHYARKSSGEIHDPISFKPFSMHSHIVAIATTGNVFLAESVKGGKDLVADVAFKKSDVITLQNPHGLPSASVPSTSSSVTKAAPPSDKSKAVTAKPVAGGVSAVKAKANVPWNVSPYSTGMPGASLTSTSVDPQTATSRLVWDEEEIMFEAIANPPKGKGKEKDVGKRRAYVRVVTSLGGGSLNLELFCEKAPKTCYNFLMLAREGKYDNCLFHRLIPAFPIQTGDPTGTGAGGESYWGTPFRDEFELKGAAKHDGRGVIAMANKGPSTNGAQWYVTFRATPHLDRKHTVFGKLVGGEDLLDTLEKLPTKEGTDRPAKPIRITQVIIYQDPFEDYKSRLEKKLAKKAEAAANGGTVGAPAGKEKKDGDEINWFGEKVGVESTATGVGGGVGKYLDLNTNKKRPLSATAADSEQDLGGADDGQKKKKKLGFGNFEGW